MGALKWLTCPLFCWCYPCLGTMTYMERPENRPHRPKHRHGGQQPFAGGGGMHMGPPIPGFGGGGGMHPGGQEFGGPNDMNMGPIGSQQQHGGFGGSHGGGGGMHGGSRGFGEFDDPQGGMGGMGGMSRGGFGGGSRGGFGGRSGTMDPGPVRFEPEHMMGGGRGGGRSRGRGRSRGGRSRGMSMGGGMGGGW